MGITPAAVRTTQFQSSSGAAHAPSNKAQRLEKVAQEYESFFAKMLIQSMYKSVKSSDSLFSPEGGGVSKKVFDDMLYEQYANAMSEQKLLGISTLITEHYKNAV